jgi:Ca2+-binding RTX toxin-like protein
MLSHHASFDLTKRHNQTHGGGSASLEHLESRRLLSITLDGQTLRITGTDGNDQLSLSRTGVDNVIARENTSSAQFDLDDINEIVIGGGAGDDVIRVTANDLSDRGIDVLLSGGLGNDSVEGAGNDESLLGDAGNDTLVGNDGNDTLDGGDGTDTLLGGAGVNIHRNGEVNSGAALPGLSIEGSTLRFEGTDDTDQVAVWRRTDGDLVFWLNGRQQNVPGDDVDDFEALGNGGNDVLRLHFTLDLRGTLNGGSGDDKLIGGALSDVLLGGEDRDTLFANAGNDTLDGGFGDDQLFGADGRDTADYSNRTANLFVNQFNVQGGFGSVSEGNGQDIVGLDIERILGGSGDDRFVGDERNNTFFGGDGNDFLFGRHGNDALHGEGGNDTLIADVGNDFLDGGDGNDTMYGQNGNDTLLARGGNDQLFAHDGARDTVDGGDGDDDTADADSLDLIDDVETVT